MKTLIKTDRNGTKYFSEQCKCWKCNGSGIYYWGANGCYSGVCFACDGSGIITTNTKEYTPEHEAKLAAQRARRQEKRRIKFEKFDADRARRQHEQEERDRKIAEEKAKSQYIGQVGDKIDKVVTLVFIADYDVPSFRGYGMTTMSVYGFVDDDGNMLVWKTGGCLYIEHEVKGFIENEYAHKGDRIHIKATIKDHSEYDGQKQTVLSRVKLIEFIEKA